MPTYEYRCPNGHLTEKIAKISESTSQIPCAVCGAVAERQISGGAALVFKGSGFYLTDYGKSGSKAEKARSESSAEGKSESKSDGKSDGKSEAKADAKSSNDSKGSDSSAKSDTATTSSKKDSVGTPATKTSPKTE